MKNLFILFVSLMPFVLFSSETRVSSLGGDSKLLLDETNVKLYPGEISSFSNTIFAEIKQPLSFNGFLGNNKYGTIGLGVNMDTLPSIITSLVDSIPSVIDNNINNLPNFEFFYGKKSIGIKIEDRFCHYEDHILDHTQYLNLLKGTLGIKYYSGPLLCVDISTSVMKTGLDYRDIDNGTPVTFKTKENISYINNIRFVQTFNNKKDVFIIGGGYEKYNEEWERISTTTTGAKLTSDIINLFCSSLFYPIENTMLLFGLNIITDKENTTIQDTVLKKTILSPIITIGTEKELTKWFTARLGLKEKISYTTTEQQIQEIIIIPEELKNDNNFNVYIGWGIKFNNIEIDVRCTDLFFNAPSTGFSLGYKF
ncbi:MAG: hypothetical protein PHX21_00535 [bacterium]|nr:hypothetical protein [bacterium]